MAVSSRAWEKTVTEINELGSRFNKLSVLILLLSSFYDEKSCYKLQLESIQMYLPNIQLRSDPSPTEVSETLVQ